MEIRYYKEYSKQLQRNMEFKVYGHGGKPCLIFPSQDGRFYDFENFHMVDACVDTIDKETFSAVNRQIKERIEQQDRLFWYLIEEFYPRMMEINKSAQSEKEGKMPMVAGCSMGAYHAANVFFRRPDLFDTVISMSGFYHLKLIVGDYMDSLVYLNSPYDSIAHLPKEHPYRGLYARSTIILCVGQGAWEEELLEETRKFDALLKQQGISAWVDYWGYDVSHDWSWWRKQWIYFLSQVL